MDARNHGGWRSTGSSWIRRVPRPNNRTAIAVAIIAAVAGIVIAVIEKWPPQAADVEPASVCKGAHVLARDGGFAPPRLVIYEGNVVTWCVEEGEHMVAPTSGPQAVRGSGLLRRGDTHTALFGAPGTYTFECYHHFGMTSVVTVEERPAAPTMNRTAPRAG